MKQLKTSVSPKKRLAFLWLSALGDRPGAQRGSIMLPLMLALAGVVVSSLGVVAVANWASLSAAVSGQGSDAQSVADAAADQVIATLNQPENRAMLVAGDTPPSTWSNTNENLRSPCISTLGVQPGSNKGMPTSTALSLTNGKERNLDDPSQEGQGSRRFVLKAIRYSAGADGSPNRRSIFRTYTFNNGQQAAGSSSGQLPAGKKFREMINLDKPANDALPEGSSTSYIAVTVEGIIYNGNQKISTSTVTKEYEVLPKCCGASFGSNGTGGLESSSDGFVNGSPVGRLGADSRFCGVEWGMVVGLNGGRFFSQLANDRYTKTSLTGAVVPISSFVGVVANKSHRWTRDRLNNQTASVRSYFGTNQFTDYTMRIGCRTVPSDCNTATDIIPGEGNNVAAFGIPKTGSNPPGQCPAVPTGTKSNGGASYSNNAFGDLGSILGEKASCIPFVPVFFPTGFLRVNPDFAHTWTTPNPLAVTSQAGPITESSVNNGGYPLLTPNDADVTIRLRANKHQSPVEAINPDGSKDPFLEYCNTKYLNNAGKNECSSIYNGSKVHSWAVISRSGNVPTTNSDTIAIGDDFSSFNSDSDTLSITASTGEFGSADGSTPRWPSGWQEFDATGTCFGITYHDLKVNRITEWFKVVGKELEFKDDSCSDHGDNNRPAIARAVNLVGIQNPVLEITYRDDISDSSSVRALSVEYSYDFANNTGFNSPNTGGAGLQADSTTTTKTGWFDIAYLMSNGSATLANGNQNSASIINSSNALTTKSSTNKNTDCPAITIDGKSYRRCRILLPTDAFASKNTFQHWFKFRLRAGKNLSTSEEVYVRRIEIKSWINNQVVRPQYKNWCEYSTSKPTSTPTIDANGNRALDAGGFHCLGPSIKLTGANNRFWIDTTDSSISFYYNSSNDFRGTSKLVGNTMPNALISLTGGALIGNVHCPRANPLTTAPVDNCVNLWPDGVNNAAGEYDRFNIFGRDTPPGTDCQEFGTGSQPCMQVVALTADSRKGNPGTRSRLAGTFIFMPWGLISFNVNDCAGIPPIPQSEFNGDDSWNYSGRLWTRSLYACGQNHFRVPPSSTTNLTTALGMADNTADLNFVAWTGQDWVARSTSSMQRSTSLK